MFDYRIFTCFFVAGTYVSANRGASKRAALNRVRIGIRNYHKVGRETGCRLQMAVVYTDARGFIHVEGSKLLQSALRESNMKEQIRDSAGWNNETVRNFFTVSYRLR